MYKMSKAPLLTAVQIQERIEALAAQIAPCDFDVILSVLTGGFMFTTDLCRHIATPKLQVAFIKASSYGNSTESSGELKISGLEHLNIRGKKVLVIDDILDSGNTMKELVHKLADFGAKELKTCVLLNKPARRAVDFNVDFVGFDIENKFVVGYGLDYANDYRTLPEIWTLEEA